MKTNFIPRLGGGENPFKSSFSNLTNHVTGKVQLSQFAPSSGVEGVSFKNVMSETMNNVNQTISAPDALMHEAMTTGNVDVHDVMIANAKAELVVNIATQMTTKVIQAYDRILQIQI